LWLRLAGAGVIIFSGISARLSAEERIDFNRQIRPILSNKCFRCHGPDASHRQADLRLDDFADATALRDGIRPIVPGKPEESEAFRRITTADNDDEARALLRGFNFPFRT
jgi:hypothetical protein